MLKAAKLFKPICLLIILPSIAVFLLTEAFVKDKLLMILKGYKKPLVSSTRYKDKNGSDLSILAGGTVRENISLVCFVTGI